MYLSTSSKDLDKIMQKKGGTIVIDARSYLQYKSGHIRSATNVDLTRNLENNIFKDKEELSKIYAKIPMNA